VKKFMSQLVYILLNIVLTPAYLLAFPFYQIPILLRRGKVSGTAYEPFNARLLYHLLGSRLDPTTLQLAAGLPATNAVVMTLMVRPLAWASRITGHLPDVFTYPAPRPVATAGVVALRCEFLDKALDDHVEAGDQVVILGAGWDTRAYGRLKELGVACFEVDAPATQAVKRAAIETTRLDAAHVTFVSCDFNRQSWCAALVAQGFDVATRTFVLWEGITMYLNADTIASTLRVVSTFPAGSRIAFDYFAHEWLFDTMAGKMSRWAVRATYGEPITFGFRTKPDLEAGLGAFLTENGLNLGKSEPFGVGPAGGVALAAKP